MAKQEMTITKIQNTHTHLLRTLLAVAMLVCGVGRSWGQTDLISSGKLMVIQSAQDNSRYWKSPHENSPLLITNNQEEATPFYLKKNGDPVKISTIQDNDYLLMENIAKTEWWVGQPTTNNVDMVNTTIKNNGWSGGFHVSSANDTWQIQDVNTKSATKNLFLTLNSAKTQVMGSNGTGTNLSPSRWNLIPVEKYVVEIDGPESASLIYNGSNLYGATQAQANGGKYYFSNTPTVDQFTVGSISTSSSVDITIGTNKITVKIISTASPTAINASNMKLGIGGSSQIYYTLEPDECWKDVTFSSSDPSVAKVDDAGMVTGVSVGTATITLVAHAYGTRADVCSTNVSITVVDKTIIYLNSRGTTANGGDSEDNTGNTTFGLAAGTVCGTHTVGQGDDANDGLSPEHPVSTWARAYSLLQSEADGGTWDNQVIVVMGYVDNTYFSVGDRLGSLSGANPKTMTVANKPVHITGKWDGVNYQGAIGRCPASAANEYYSGLPVNADTKFSHLQLYKAKTEVKCYFVFYAHYHNLYLGEGLIMNEMPVGDVSTLGGTADCVTTNAHIFGGYFDLQYIPSDHSAYVNKNTQDRKDINPKQEGFTITIMSGYWGVVSVGGRSGQTLISGSPEAPLKGRIVIDIDHENSNTAANAKNAVNGNKPCNYDIGCVLAGNHGGTMYADSEIDIYEGTISRVVNGTLGQVFGENGTSGGFHKKSGSTETATPFDSFFGRAVVNVSPRNNDNSKVKITEFYCGGLGRQTGNGPTSETQTNFYGHSIVNINGGTFENALFGAGAGGTNGIGLLSNWNTTTFKTAADGTPLHCKDKLLPYWVPEVGNVNDRNVLYGPDNANLVDITVKNFKEDGTYTTETFNIRDTKTTVTINGGVFGTAAKRASLYAGGWGEVNKALINYESQTPSTLAGDIFGGTADGLCSELIINGGTIYGEVYGAGKGSTTYYDYYNSLASKKSPGNNHAASEYLHLGTIVGNTRVFVGGNTIVNGSVYGGGDAGQLVGNSNVEIGGTAEVTGNVYGGGNMAEVSGTTKVQIGEECITE